MGEEGVEMEETARLEHSVQADSYAQGASSNSNVQVQEDIGPSRSGRKRTLFFGILSARRLCAYDGPGNRRRLHFGSGVWRRGLCLYFVYYCNGLGCVRADRHMLGFRVLIPLILRVI
jgi:hypothetical protein